MTPSAAKQILFLSHGDASRLEAWAGPAAGRCVVNHVLEPTDTLAVIELWSGGNGAAEDLAALGFQVAAYAVEEQVERRLRPIEAGGLVQLAAWRARPELTREEARLRWDEHVPLALEVHGAASYVRNWVAAPAEPGGLCGVAALTYADAADYEQRRYLGEGGAARIAADVARFIGEVEVLLAVPRLIGAPQVS